MYTSMLATNLKYSQNSCNFVQPHGKIVTNNIVSPDVVLGMQKCSKICD